MSLYLARLMLSCRPVLQGLEVRVLESGDPNFIVCLDHYCCLLSYFLGHLGQRTQGGIDCKNWNAGASQPVDLSRALAKWAKRQ